MMPYKSKTEKNKRSSEYYRMLKATPEGRERLRQQRKRAAKKYLSKPEGKARRAQYHKTPAARLKTRMRRLRLNHGITLDDYNAMVAAQNSECAICLFEQTAFHIDHDHKTGKIRGLLCQRCNNAIGLLDDAPERLESAAAYIRKNGGG